MTEQGEAGFNPSSRLRSMRGGGQEYLDVKWRWVWLDADTSRGMEEAVGYTAHSECLQISDTFAMFKATVAAIRADGSVIREVTGHGSETKGDFGDFIEKAETKAMGRALQHLGYGSAAAADDGERIADSPVDRSAANRPAPRQQAAPAPAQRAARAPRQQAAPTAAPAPDAAPAPAADVQALMAPVRAAADERHIDGDLHRIVTARLVNGVRTAQDADLIGGWVSRYDADGWARLLPHLRAFTEATTPEQLHIAGQAANAAGIDDDDLRACWRNRNAALTATARRGAA